MTDTATPRRPRGRPRKRLRVEELPATPTREHCRQIAAKLRAEMAAHYATDDPDELLDRMITASIYNAATDAFTDVLKGLTGLPRRTAP